MKVLSVTVCKDANVNRNATLAWYFCRFVIKQILALNCIHSKYMFLRNYRKKVLRTTKLQQTFAMQLIQIVGNIIFIRLLRLIFYVMIIN